MEAFYKNWLQKFATKRHLLSGGNEEDDDRPSQPPGDNPTQQLNSPTEIIYETDSLKLIVEKSPFRRQKVFRVQDHLFKFKVVQKKDKRPILLSELFDFLHAALTHVLESIKSFYDPQDHNIAYLTLHQDPMVNGLNTGNKCKFCFYHLKTGWLFL